MKLLNCDSLKVIPQMENITCIFADPPDNIGLDYDTFDDQNDDYEGWLEEMVNACAEAADICWWSFNAKWTFAMGAIVQRLMDKGMHVAKPCVQVFTFGQHNSNDLGNNHRPLWRIMRRGAVLYPENIRVPSWRQLNGDKRANPAGRVPGDVLDMQYPYGPLSIRCCEGEITFTCPVEIPFERGDLREIVINEPLIADVQAGDVFDFPRVTGNSKQRCAWHPTQLHEDMVERCIKLSTKPGDLVVDPFGGTGTTLRVCQRISRDCVLLEMDHGYCEKIATQNRLTKIAGGWG